MFHGILTTTAGSPSTLPRCFSRRKDRRLTSGLWLAQAHAYAMALAGVLPGHAAAAITRRCLSSNTCSRTLPSFTVDLCVDPPPRTSWSLTLHPWPPGLLIISWLLSTCPTIVHELLCLDGSGMPAKSSFFNIWLQLKRKPSLDRLKAWSER